MGQHEMKKESKSDLRSGVGSADSAAAEEIGVDMTDIPELGMAGRIEAEISKMLEDELAEKDVGTPDVPEKAEPEVPEKAEIKPVAKPETPKKAKPEKPEKPAKKHGEKTEKAEKPKDSKKKKRLGLKITVGILGFILVAFAVVIFGVYANVHPCLIAELGEGAPEASAFAKGDAKVTYASEPDISLTEEGNYVIDLKVNDSSRKVLLIVRDTKAPEAESADCVLTIDDEELAPEKALKNIKEASKFTAEWQTAPIFCKAGSYDCSVLLRDSYGNESLIKVTVKVLGVAELVEHEAGTARPTLEDFMVVERQNAILVTDFDEIDWNKLGDNTVEVKIDGTLYKSVLRIVDTVAPVPDIVPAAVVKNGSVDAADFVVGCEDATEVSYALKEAPDTSKLGDTDCVVVATDEGGNTAELSAKLFVCDAVAELEASNDTLTEAILLKALGADYSGYKLEGEGFLMNSLGAHVMKLSKDDAKATVAVVIKDTTAPTAKGINCPCSTGYPCDAIKFLTDIVDVSPVKAGFVTEPDWSLEGEQAVEIVLTDRAGNQSTVKATAVISPDKTAPVIYAARDRYCYVGEAVAYFKEVFAVDNADPSPEITVDKSKVDSKTPGEYEVIYTAKDHEGNESSVTVKFKFIRETVTDDKLNAEVDRVLGKILTEGMTLEQQAYAIFEYVYDNVTYWEGSDKTDWKAEAYRGLTKGVGDCFTFYSTTYALLQKIDCQVLSVERLNGRTQHFWCLVNLGTGWYHFDPCNVGPEHLKCFMKTSEELVKYSVQYWRFDTTLYPQLETRPYVMGN